MYSYTTRVKKTIFKKIHKLSLIVIIIYIINNEFNCLFYINAPSGNIAWKPAVRILTYIICEYRIE